ncbi:acyltransferase family protein [Ferruginibacter albus]|uniref:acyltransferase family protein n=1 Tax=Ferruginibacter albus TaxID=2875540 RepID=UPI001CC82EB0|nr:acyltransferase [Ferruginibacter albus]UAY53516.1 acyltransferase [Ferruginibacter albus]
MQSTPLHHYNNFNLLRLLGAACVLFSHTYYVVGQSEKEPLNLLLNGALEASGVGLTIFFFISGYFITKSATETHSVLLFLKKRALRIYPALIVLVVLSIFLAGPLLTSLSLGEYFTSKETWLYLGVSTGFWIRTGLPGVFSTPAYYVHAFNTSLWSITLELELYASIAVLLWTGLLRKKAFGLLAGCIVLISFLTVSFKQDISVNIARQLNLIAIFYSGSFVYAASIKAKHLLLIAFLTAILYFIFSADRINSFMTAPLLLLCICCCVYLIGSSKKIVVPFNTDISYGVYIYAFPVQQIMYRLSGYNNSVMLSLLYSGLATIALAFASWHLIEKRFLVLKYGSLSTRNLKN